MNTEKMIAELSAVAEKHKNDFVQTFQTNISAMCKDIILKLEQLEKYKKIGTIEECREAMEKQEARKPELWGDGCDGEGKLIYDMYDCPNCGKSYEVEYEEYGCCPNCGQRILWEPDGKE